MAFEITEAKPEEIREVLDLSSVAYGDDELFAWTFADVPEKERDEFMDAFLNPRMKLADYAIYIIKDESTGKIVAWTALQWPWDIRPLSPELKTKILAHDPADLPPFPEGLKVNGFVEFGNCIGLTTADYDPEKHFHKRGTMIHPDYQRRGLGTKLTQHTNKITDEAGRPTFVPCRYTSWKMFQSEGFKQIADHHPPVEMWGGDPEKAYYRYAMREPQLTK
ncbi:hypothetical protein F5884DRAFT_853207 [Xylogone sp. PMI_703]|nr:hypothetical protein F5884DRAFT_853207 [Xylogone sp. PMI_703]